MVDQVERQAFYVAPDLLLETLKTEPALLPPGQASVPFVWSQSLEEMLGGAAPPVPLELVLVGAHMHERGQKWTLELDNGSGFECIGRVNRWDFNWQRAYTYLEPPTLQGSSRLKLTCEYDTSGETAPVSPGWGTRNEMCLSVMMLAFPPGIGLE